MANPSPNRYPQAGPNDALLWCDLRSILDSHGLRLAGGSKHHRTEAARLIRREFKAVVTRERVAPGRSYVLPLRALTEHISFMRRDLITDSRGTSWAVLVDAINDPASGLEIVRLRFAGAA